jgi:acyl carrier protein
MSIISKEDIFVNNNIFDFIADRIVEIADISREEIDENSEIIDDLCLSSLEIMSVIGDVEIKYNIQFSGEELSNIRTISNLVTEIQNKIN